MRDEPQCADAVPVSGASSRLARLIAPHQIYADMVQYCSVAAQRRTKTEPWPAAALQTRARSIWVCELRDAISHGCYTDEWPRAQAMAAFIKHCIPRAGQNRMYFLAYFLALYAAPPPPPPARGRTHPDESEEMSKS